VKAKATPQITHQQVSNGKQVIPVLGVLEEQIFEQQILRAILRNWAAKVGCDSAHL
jgi:hypothetical protein